MGDEYEDPASGRRRTPAAGRLAVRLLALVLDQDWLAAAGSMAHQLDPMTQGRGRDQRLDAPSLGLARADHFSWMKQSQAMVQPMLDWLSSWLSDIADDRRHRLP